MRVLTCLFTEHHLGFVLLAAAMCAVGAAVTIRLFRRAARQAAAPRHGWQFLTGVCAGATIWSAHFIAMLGYRADASVSFDPVMTILSLFVAIGGAYVGLGVASGARNVPDQILGGVLLGLAIAGMHYSGMLAYRVDAPVSWDSGYILASIALGCAFAIAAIVVARRPGGTNRTAAATALLALAIVGLHFTGMAAFDVTPVPGGGIGPGTDEFRAMAISIALVGLVILGTGVSSYMIDDRTRADSNERLRQMALQDPLTGLPNRASFYTYLEWILSAERAPIMRIAVIGIDLNRFKEINDVWGHSAGDRTLCAIAERLRGCVEQRDFVARFGGDEFCAIRVFEDEAELHRFVESIEELTFRPLQFDDFEIAAGASIGVAVYPRDGGDADALIRNADLAMHRAKTDDASNIRYYDTQMGDVVRERRGLVNDLRHAIGNGELQVHYQVQTHIASGDISGYEALLRWTHPVRGPISPAVFIPLAEADGSILALGEWVLQRACRDAANWDRKYKVAVNLSAVQLSHSDLPKLVHQVLLETGLPPARLELELTETAVSKDKSRSLHVIRQIKALGVSVALDDFGTGYSSLDTLRNFPFDKIKLDRSFVEHLGSSPQAMAIVRAVMALGKSLSIPVLAEGIETEHQLQVLKGEGCDEAQGYFLGRPVPADQLAAQGGPADMTADAQTVQAARATNAMALNTQHQTRRMSARLRFA